MPDAPPTSQNVFSNQLSEAEPLLGRAGAVRQREDAPFWKNLFLGTGFLAQIGLLVLLITVWISIFSLPLGLFTLHPLFNSVGILLIFEAVLLLQPTHTPGQKIKGAIVHSILIGASLLLLIGAGVAIVLNKVRTKHSHLDSVHAILGLLVYVIVLGQTIVGFAQFYTPHLFGSTENAKAIYKYHRIAGYTIQLLLIATLVAASRTTFALGPLKFTTWKVAFGSILVALGVFPRIKKEKLGFNH
ncbi:hypothetical protein TWF173_002335 [Orbilia oligospora]|uniref:Cytochrome b561 domain-containing protein n=1 Tax=Orbilia oligospora TaxID=2813651 RepID=A0A7C8V899_ORBOL|nr:hypothetical protein TWF970_009909 [Orbilia oligospora]KAF3307794.1 hypothetical protein TWF173_002335 [Orbilia oligospora]